MMIMKRYGNQTREKQIRLIVEPSGESSVHDTKFENKEGNSTDKKPKKITRVDFRTEHEKRVTLMARLARAMFPK